MPLQSVELVLDPATDEAVRALWQALSDAGLPSQADHRGPTNAPHVTLGAVAAVAPAAEAALVPLAARLPMRLRLGAPALLGERRPALVLPVRGGAALDVLHADVDAALAPGPVRPESGPPETGGGAAQGQGAPSAVPALPWVPHVTLARRLRTGDVEPALAVLADVPAPHVATAVALRRWDPDRRLAWLVGTA